MKIKDLEAFRAVMSTGSTQAAAELLGISQSAVSRRLTQLESDFEQELFFRDGSRLMPSRINGLLEPRIADVLERVSMLQQAVNDLKTGRFSEALLRVAVPPVSPKSLCRRSLQISCVKTLKPASRFCTGPTMSLSACWKKSRPKLASCASRSPIRTSIVPNSSVHAPYAPFQLGIA
ncbi:LysR family transcriptional regulator [Ochrobactrum cytisi]|nr:LysR family transcriptional regulator [Brucella cytisi]